MAAPEEIRDHLEQLREAGDAIEQGCIEICYHMKGVTWNEAWGMSSAQRNKIVTYINKIYKEREEAQSGRKSM